jgi:hypothetical protein
MLVKVGYHKLYVTYDDLPTIQVREVLSIVPHSDYDNATHANDIAIVLFSDVTINGDFW